MSCPGLKDKAGKDVKLCLNDFLLSGPDLVNRLVGVLLRMRRHPVVISSDIKAFFHRIFVDSKDSPSFRFYWFADKKLKRMIILEMIVHIFGAKSSPCVATYVLRYHGHSLKGQISEETLYAILKAFYVDDLLSSQPDVATARAVRIELQESLLKGGFELAKWKCTHCGALANADDKAAAEAEEKMLEDPSTEVPVEKVLGVSYSFQADKFCIKVGKRVEQKTNTRRELLSLVASVFDPMGFVCPATLRGKIHFQKATSLELGWDDGMPGDLQTEVDKWKGDLHQLVNLKIDRWMATVATTKGKVQLHMFSDASPDAYGIAGYVRFFTGDEIHVALIFARAHVVPLDMSRRIIAGQEDHHNSMPKLELTAAKLGASVADMLVRELEKEITFDQVYMWTDSETILKWI